MLPLLPRSCLAVLIGGLVSVSCGDFGSGQDICPAGCSPTEDCATPLPPPQPPLPPPPPSSPPAGTIVAGLGDNTQCVGDHCSTFVAGAVCDGVDVSTPAVDMLRGKHLIIQDMEWMPYAAPNPGGRHWSGWKGLNIELFDHFATVLGYTYNMSNMGYAQEGESWTQQVYRAIDDADLTGSYWVEDDERLNKASFIRGTYDLTPVLVARMLGAGETKWETWYKSFYNFLDPFDKTLWFMILGFIIFSGVVDWLVERKSVNEARVTSSIYEYFAGLCGDARLEPSSCTTSSNSHRSTHA